MARFLYEIEEDKDFGMLLSEISGGNLHNAIAREAYAVIGVKDGCKESIRIRLNAFIAEMQNELRHTEPTLTIGMESVPAPSKVFKKKFTRQLLSALIACPHGVLGMSQDVEGMVETSTNLAAIKMRGDSRIEVVTSQRSSIESQKDYAVDMVSAVFRLAGAEVLSNSGYPAWQPNKESPLLSLAVREYETLFNKKPLVMTIHAGLECGLFLDKYPHLDMISFGPDILDVHSPRERINIASVQKFWDFLVKILENIE